MQLLRHGLFLIMVCVLGLPAAQAAAAESSMPAYLLPQSATFDVKSDRGETYAIMVALPASPPPPEGWPVLYVLDGEDNFAIAALTARRLAGGGDRGGVAPGIVVGISAGPLARRVRDYTPSTPGWTIAAGQPASGLPTGGSETFLDMVAARIMPTVRANWRVDQSREFLFGHSFGGLLALHAVLTRPDLFDGAVAVSPSLWFGGDLIKREIARTTGNSRPMRVLLAESDQAAPNGASAGKAAEDAATQLRLRQAQGDIRYLALEGQTHGTTMLAAMAPAISFAFRRETK